MDSGLTFYDEQEVAETIQNMKRGFVGDLDLSSSALRHRLSETETETSFDRGVGGEEEVAGSLFSDLSSIGRDSDPNSSSVRTSDRTSPRWMNMSSFTSTLSALSSRIPWGRRKSDKQNTNAEIPASHFHEPRPGSSSPSSGSSSSSRYKTLKKQLLHWKKTAQRTYRSNRSIVHRWCALIGGTTFLFSVLILFGVIRGMGGFSEVAGLNRSLFVFDRHLVAVKSFNEAYEADPEDSLFYPCRRLTPEELLRGEVVFRDHSIPLNNILEVQESLLLDRLDEAAATNTLPPMRYVLPKMWTVTATAPPALSASHDATREMLHTQTAPYMGRHTDENGHPTAGWTDARGLNLCVLSMRVEDDSVRHFINPIQYDTQTPPVWVESNELFRVFRYIPPQTGIARKASIGYSTYDWKRTRPKEENNARVLVTFDHDFPEIHYDPVVLSQQAYDLLLSQDSMAPEKLLRTF